LEEYFIDNALDELDEDHDDGVIDEDQICDHNGACSLEIRECSNGEVDGVEGVSREAKGEVIEGEALHAISHW
jgi:hypothetical protein